MADLTSTIRVTCTLGGKVIAFTHTATVADVYDVGNRQSQGGSGSGMFKAVDGASDGDGGYPTFSQPSPDYLLWRNDGVSAALATGLTLDGGNGEMACHLTPGVAMILMAPTTGGLAKVSATATESTLDVGEVFTPGTVYTGYPVASLMLAYNTAS